MAMSTTAVEDSFSAPWPPILWFLLQELHDSSSQLCTALDDSYAVEGNEQIGHLPGGNGYSTGG